MLHNNYAVLFLTFCNIKVTLFITNKARKDFFLLFGVFVGLFFYYTVWMEERTMKAKKMVAAFLAMAASNRSDCWLRRR